MQHETETHYRSSINILKKNNQMCVSNIVLICHIIFRGMVLMVLFIRKDISIVTHETCVKHTAYGWLCARFQGGWMTG